MQNSVICNQGSAWGLVENGEIVKIIAIILLFVAMYFWYNIKNKAIRIGLSLIILGGAINLFERFYYGCVRDYWKPFAWWPTFNVADVLIVIGICIVTISFIKKDER